MSKELTAAQKKIMDYLATYMLTEGRVPSVRELADYFHISSTAAYCHLKALDKKGYIDLSSHKARSLKIKAEGYTTRADIVSMPFYQDSSAVRRAESLSTFQLSTLLLDSSKEYFALYAEGEQMENAGIMPGDLLVFERNSQAESNDIVLASADEEQNPFVRRLKLHGSRYELIPECDSSGIISCQECLIYGILRTLVRNYAAV